MCSKLKNNYGEPCYLINDGSCRFRTDDIGYSITSPWTVDKRDPSGKITVWRDIEELSNGMLGFEFIADIPVPKDGTCFKISDSAGKSLMNLEISYGNYLFNGVKTNFPAQSGTVFVKIKADLDKHTAMLFIDGKKASAEYSLADVSASRVSFSFFQTDEKKFAVHRCDVYKNYAINEIFLVPESSALADWTVTGSAQVARTGGQRYNDYNSALLGGKSSAKQAIPPMSGSVVFECYMLFPEKSDCGSVSLLANGVTAAKLTVNADGVFKSDGTKLRHHTNNIWQCLRIEADTVSGKILYKVNGKKVGEFSFDNKVDYIDEVLFESDSGNVYFDDVKLFLEHEYEDYCPKPVPTPDDGYDVILNICSLWHEGSHSGWGCESAYPDIETALGFYDEGIPEVADWEIKFMVENGIDIQHLCWYCPSGDINEPIKRSNLNWALHDGFFNAKYSDMMKFTLMWENGGTNVHCLEQFKEYIWKYWMDYYFTDDRFYTIDNKIVFTVWSFRNFITGFGGTGEGCLEAVDFMNRDAKANGFDGVMIFFADSHRTDAETFDTMAKIGGTAAYAYHWLQFGVHACDTIPRLQKNQDFRKIHIVPTVSVGFNNVGWSGVRKPMASLEDHKEVLEYIKNTYLPAESGWKAKTLIVSTWNEYGEGTYVMPCKGLHGFGYLENVAEVISGVTDHSSNIYPTENQKKRLGHMYTGKKTSLERFDIEQPYFELPEKLIYRASGADMEPALRIDEYSISCDTIKASSTSNDSSVAIRKDRNFKPVSAKDIGAVRMVLKSNVDADAELFFTTDICTQLEGKNCLKFRVKKSDDFTEYVIPTARFSCWKDEITSFRLDILNKPGTFEVKSFELLGLSDRQKPLTLYINSVEYSPVFPPEVDEKEIYVAAEPEAGFFEMHHFYYEWSRFTGKLYIAYGYEKDAVFTVGKDIAVINGKEVRLDKALSLRDGLPLVPLLLLYDSFGIEYKRDGKTLEVTASAN